MCGIVGFLDLRQRFARQEATDVANLMAAQIGHRGPDAFGAWADETAGIAFGHRRLSIVDLSEAGSQPMISASGRSVISFNGEIYNASDLRPALEGRGIKFRGHSDTEVILEAFETFGVNETAQRLIGMFALAWWDKASGTLWLLRDRVGKKPLYYACFDNLILFGSQLKSLMVHPQWDGVIDRDALAAYMRFGYFPSSQSVFRRVRQLRPGTSLTFQSTGSRAGEPVESVYWNPYEIAAEPRLIGDENELVEKLERLLADAVARRMVADVPLGAFLSGGVDSSTVVALMQEQSSRPIKTFSIGFGEARYNEAPYAKAIANHLGTDHTELYVDPATALDLVPKLTEWFDEPFADASQIPTLLVSQLARRDVTVALSGDGGDELFHGYPWYRFGSSLGRMASSLPLPLRQGIANLLTVPDIGRWDSVGRMSPKRFRIERLGDRIHKLAGWMSLPTHDLLFREIRSLWSEPGEVLPGAVEQIEPIWSGAALTAAPNFSDRMSFIDLLTYLPDDILTKVDRATMAVSLEGRCPILDHRIVEFALRLPRKYKGAGAQTKIILKEVLARHLPRHLFERPKQGFESPIAVWLRGPLRDWAESLLEPSALRADGILEPAPILKKWTEHQTGNRNWQYALWNVLMFQEWKRRWA